MTGIDDKHQPDSLWIVAVIATYQPDDEIFDKSYVPPPRPNKLSQYKTIDFPDGFVNGLPPSRSMARSRRLKMF